MATLIKNSWKEFAVHSVANGTIVVSGNNSVSNVAMANQDVYGATITRVWHGSDSGTWTIKRGANVVYCVSGSGYHYFDGVALTVDRSANVVLELSGSANGFIIVECRKDSN